MGQLDAVSQSFLIAELRWTFCAKCSWLPSASLYHPKIPSKNDRAVILNEKVVTNNDLQQDHVQGSTANGPKTYHVQQHHWISLMELPSLVAMTISEFEFLGVVGAYCCWSACSFQQNVQPASASWIAGPPREQFGSRRTRHANLLDSKLSASVCAAAKGLHTIHREMQQCCCTVIEECSAPSVFEVLLRYVHFLQPDRLDADPWRPITM